jgi:hypothetical protein
LTEAAFRAAGQAFAALWRRGQIDHVDIEGITLEWSDEPPREQAKIEIVIELGGIAAQQKFRFRSVSNNEFICSWQFTECQLEDFGLVHDLVTGVGACEVDVLYRSWCRVLEFPRVPSLCLSWVQKISDPWDHLITF